MIGRLKIAGSFTPKTAAIGLHAVNGIISANIFIYITALFLSSYPATWIPYFFIGRTIIEIATSFLAVPALNKNIVRTSILFQLGSVGFIVLFAITLTTGWYILPLIFSLLLTIAGLLSGLIAWNSVRNAFDIIEFKQISTSLPIASVIGKIVISLCNTWLIKIYGIEYLPYLTAILIFLSCIYILSLKPLPILIQAPKEKRSPIRYPLFVNLFLFSFILAFCYTLVDYSLRIKLMDTYNTQEIGQFISIFTAITYFLSTILTFLLSKPLIKLGIPTLLEVLPIYWIIVPLGVIFYPDMAMITLMGAGDYVFYNFINIGRSLLLNVLPNEIRAVGQVAVQTVSESAGIGVASLALILFTSHITLPRVAFIIFLVALFLVFFARRLHSNYVSTLKEEIFLKRFSVDESDIESYQSIIEENITQSLISPDPKVICFGYSLLSTIKMSSIPSIVLEHINFEHREIRIQAIKTIIAFKELSSMEKLLNLLKSEKDPEVKWWIINALAEFQPGSFVAEAREWLNDTAPEVKAGGIRVLFDSPDPNDIKLASTALSMMLQEPGISNRRIAARVLTKIPLQKIIQHLSSFIADSDDIVSSYAIDAVYQNNQIAFAPDVIVRLSKGGVFYSARKLINKLDDQAVALLMKIIMDNKDNIRIRVDILVAALAQMLNQNAEISLATLAETHIVLIRQATALESLHRAQHFRISDFYRQKALKFALEEAELIHILHLTLKKYPATHIVNEIHARIQLAFTRYLNWCRSILFLY